MKERIQTLPTVTLKDIFPESSELNIKELLKDIPTNAILTIIAHFMAQIHTREDDFELQKEIIFRWINQQDENTRTTMIDMFNKLIDKHGAKINFFNNISSLYFYQHLFENFTEGDIRNLTADEELRLFKAYLLVSTHWTEREIAHLSQRPKNDGELVSYILPFQMTHNEIQSSKDFRSQLIKAIYFFRFIENNQELKPFLSDFLKHYGLDSWQKYLTLTIIPYVMSLTGTRSTVLVFDSNNKIETDFWDAFCIQIKDYIPKADFLELRESPIYKLKDYQYLFYNYNFVIDKLFQALQFVFSKILIDKGVIKNFSDFKSKYYSEVFSENYLFYSIIKYCLQNQNKVITLNGNDLASKLGYKGPDYYIRIGNNIILIEFKDILMGAPAKVSYDFQKIKTEVHKKLVQNEGGYPKGVGQLANFINKFPKGNFDFDPISSEEINIHPMLIVTDSTFTLFGINFLLEEELKSMIRPEKYRNIKHLGLLNIDTLLIFQDIFNENRVNFYDILIGYDFDCKRTNSIYKFSSLDSYFIEYINYHNIPSRGTPKILKDFLLKELQK